MLLFSYDRPANLQKPQIEIHPISTNDMEKLILKWSKNESLGFIAATTEEEKEFIKSHIKNFYLAVYGDDERLKQPVGMFALFDIPIDSDIEKNIIEKKVLRIKELDYFYIIPQIRGRGIGNVLIQEAKRIAKESGADLIVLQTLDPHLNQFYKKNGAKVVCDSQYPKDPKVTKNPTSFMRINLALTS